MNIEYAAGLIDGEGWIGIQRTTSSFQVRMRITMSDKGIPALLAMQRHFGGRIEPRKEHRETHRPTTSWTVSGEHAGELISRLRPHLIVKREPADLALEFHAMLTDAPKRPSRGRYWTEEMRDRAKMLMLRIQEANRRGPDPEPPTLPDDVPIAVYRWGWWWEPEDSLFGPVEFEGKFPMNGVMISGHVYERPPVPTSSHGDATLPTPTTRDHKDHMIRREPHRPDSTDTLSRALTVTL